MPISILKVEEFGGDDPVSRTVSVTNPDWSAIEAAVMRLDGWTRTTAVLEQNVATVLPEMVIEGQTANYYYCHVCFVDGEYFMLVDPTQPETIVDFSFERVPTPWSRVGLVDQLKVLQAARVFFDTGILDLSLAWESTLGNKVGAWPAPVI